ncbi:MAG: ArsR/SmtB family transcription factor [Promethearchaeota archaeon]
MNGKNETNKNTDEFLQVELFEAISHPTRIKILKLLNDKELGFSELKRKLGLSSSGNLTHHLNKLLNLISNNPNGNYEISDMGKDALFMIEIAAQKDKNWMATIYGIIYTLSFYSVYITIWIILDAFFPLGFHPIFSIPIALILSTINFYSSRLMFQKKYRNTK